MADDLARNTRPHPVNHRQKTALDKVKGRRCHIVRAAFQYDTRGPACKKERHQYRLQNKAG
jgi:hypothetical protein